jgi:hypothetical protein
MPYDINETELVPYLIAEKVTNNIKEQDFLIAKAENCYKNNAHFRDKINKSKDPRETLKTFMFHWLGNK